jgi:replicative DNA helicase
MEGDKPTEGMAELIVGKQRNGPTGEVQLAFVKDYARFENLALPTFDEYVPTPGGETPF